MEGPWLRRLPCPGLGNSFLGKGGSHLFLVGRGGRAIDVGWQGGEVRPPVSRKPHLLSILDQSGVASNLAIWRVLQSVGHTTAINLIMLPTWCNLALAPIWSIWRRAQSGNLAAEAIWRNTTKSIEIRSPLPGTHDIDKTSNGNGIRLGR